MRWRERGGRREDGPELPAGDLHASCAVNTEHAVLQRYFGVNAIPVATDRFINKSRDAYPLPFLAREITQNYVDHNPERGTLNGVRIRVEENVGRRGRCRFTIEGGWSIDDPTGLTSLHSDKPEEGESAGGNGIGLKQTVLRYLRDFGVERFYIQGRGFGVEYMLARAAQVNSDLETRGSPDRLRHDWLVAQVKPTPKAGEGRNSYVIETDNPEVIRSLREIENIGVSDRNPYLQNPDYSHQHGCLKWQTLQQIEAGEQTGLYINGQAWSFKKPGDTLETYFRGPEGVTVRFNDLRHQMSIDRPPVSTYQLNSHLDRLVRSMGKEGMIDQLKRSRHIWEDVADDAKFGTDRLGCHVVIERIVTGLQWDHEYKNEEFSQHFPGKYLSAASGVSDEQVANLREEGYTIVPEYFNRIGVSSVRTRLGEVDGARTKKPKLTSFKSRRQAMEMGFVVYGEEIADAYGAEFLKVMLARLSGNITGIEERPDMQNTFRINFGVGITEDALFHPLPTPRTEEQRFLHTLRGVIMAGVSGYSLREAITSQGEYVTTYETRYDSVTESHNLIARNNQSPNDQGVFLEFQLEPELAAEFRRIVADPATFASQRPPVSVAQTGETAAAAPTDLGAGLEEPPGLVEHDDGDREGVRSGDTGGRGVRPLWLDEEPERPKGKTLRNILIGAAVTVAGVAGLGYLLSTHPATTPSGPNLGRGKPARSVRVEDPRVADALHTLNQAIPPKDSSSEVADEYQRWKNSGDFYGGVRQKAGYLNGETVSEILQRNEQAPIPPSSVSSGGMGGGPDEDLSGLSAALGDLANRVQAPEDRVEDFHIIGRPTERQLAQLGLLRTYLHLTTGVALPQDFFLYTGRGAKGVNIQGGRAIGFHAGLLGASLEEAVSVGVHELAHCNPEAVGHDKNFIATSEALFASINGTLTEVGQKLEHGQGLTTKEKAAFDIPTQWDDLRTQ